MFNKYYFWALYKIWALSNQYECSKFSRIKKVDRSEPISETPKIRRRCTWLLYVLVQLQYRYLGTKYRYW